MITTLERGVSNTSYGSQYTDYTVSKSVGVLKASFKADFWRARSGCGSSKITKAYQPSVIGVGTNGEPSVKIERAEENLIYNQPALASLKFNLTASVGGLTSGTTSYLVLSLRNGTMSIYWD